MASERQVSIVETRSVTSGLIESTAEAKALDAAIDGVTESSKVLTQAEINLQGAIDRMDAKYNEATRDANELARAQGLIARARAQNVGDEAQYARILAGVAEKQASAAQRAAGGMQQLGRAANDNAKNFGLASHQIQNLGFQLNDLVVQIGSGGGIFRPLLQQGAQVQQILSMSEGGVSGVLGRVAEKMRAIGPAAIIGWGAAAAAIGSVVGATALAVKSMIDYREETLKTQRVLETGPGRLSGVSQADVGAAAERASKSSQGLSTSDLREIATEFARTGKIGKDVMADLTEVTERYAKTLGVDAAEGAKQLAAAFADPAKGALFLADQLQFLDGAQIAHIATLQRTEGRLAAQAELYRLLARGPLVDLEKEITTLTGAWDAFWKNVEKGGDRVVQTLGKIGAPRSREQQIQDIDALPGTGPGGQKTEEDIRRRQEAITRLREEMTKLAQQTEKDNAQAAARLGDVVTRSLDQIGQSFLRLQEDAKKLQDALASGIKLEDAEATAQALEMVKNAMDGATTAAEARAKALERTQAQSNLAVSAIQAETQATLAKTDAERMAAAEQQAQIAREQAILALRGTKATQQQMEIAGEIAYQQAIAQSNAQRQLRLQQGDEEIAQGARDLAQQQLNIQSQNAYTAAEQQAAAAAQANAAAQEAYRQAIEKGYKAEQAATLAQQAHNKVMADFEGKVEAAVKAADRQIRGNELQLKAINATTVAARAKIAAEQSMLDTENSLMTQTQRLTIAEQERQKVLQQAEASVRQMIVAQEGELALLSASISSIGMERAAREALLAGIRAENQLRSMGIDIGSAAAQQYIANAEAIGAMTVELERAEAAQRGLNSAVQDFGRTGPRTILGASEGIWRQQMDTLNQALSGGGFQVEEAASPLRTAEATVKAHNKAVEAAQASEEAAKSAADAAKASKDAVDNLDTGAIGTEIDRLRSLQEAALSRAYRPDPYAERNPEFFYNGEQIMKAQQDKIFLGLQTQIEKLQGLQASLGTLIAQGAQLPVTLVNALIAAGFGNIARDIADALAPTSVPSATPNPTSVMWTIDDVLPEGAARQPIYKEFVSRGIMGSAVSVNRIHYGRQ